MAIPRLKVSPTAPSGRCRVDELLKVAMPNPHREPGECYAPATRSVQLGEHLVTNVCLWCSLVATERLSARLVSAPT